METDKTWLHFIKSGKVNDYLTYVNSCKEKEITNGFTNAVHDRSVGNKGNRDRGE